MTAVVSVLANVEALSISIRGSILLATLINDKIKNKHKIRYFQLIYGQH